ncbi:DUF1549 domain-containing protein [Humisphaera borealis]|nr:PSD1 and planctomycete cytochrome C domain-containing protein [Humisphaera borealis]
MLRAGALQTLIVLLLASPGVGAASGKGAARADVLFERDIRPIFKTHCFHCHGEDGQLKAGLDLRLQRLALQGGKHGSAIVPGKPAESLLVQKLREGEMPPEEKPRLTPQQIELIARWVEQGARVARPEPQAISEDHLITDEERNYWAFQPLVARQVPAVRGVYRVRTPIDAFVLAKLEEKGLTFSPDTDRPTLIRRATFDLTGLPPTPAEVKAFVADTSADAFEHVIDRLLASPRYGERWGRHWLDVAGYADSDGYNEVDTERKFAWRYRDYVIKSIQADMPFDQFIVEQLAGDELVKPPYEDLSPADVEKLTATGFLRMAPDGSAVAPAADKKAVLNQVIADEIKVVSTALLGLTVGCAQCHDHRYDPIPQVDYFRFRAIFEPAYDAKSWRLPQQRLIPLLSDADRQRGKDIEAQAAKLDSERKKWEDELVEAEFQKQLASIAENLREPLTKAFKTPVAKRTAAQTKLLKAHPNANIEFGNLASANGKLRDEQKKRLDAAADLRATKPSEEFVAALTEVPGNLPPTHVFNRGDCDQPKQAVTPAELRILGSPSVVAIPEKDKTIPTSGRRLAYARWLTSGKHPLVGRVLVNRFWMHHLGRGIVASPGDFGTLGERPTHPELLDWLAADFTANGWQLKRLHKQIMLSTVYRQSARHDAAQDAIDPDNKLLGHWSLRRLDAEQFRDAVLMSSGKLNEKMFGPPVPVMNDPFGQVVIGKENLSAGRPGPVLPMNGEDFRRSVYVQFRRSRPLSLLATFDSPSMEPNCEARKASTVAPQSLLLMNNEFVIDRSVELAERVRAEAGPDAVAQAKRAWQLAIGNEPGDADVEDLRRYLAEQTARFEARKPSARTQPATQPVAKAAGAKTAPATKPSMSEPSMQALGTLGQALWSSNAFLYID